MAGYEPILHAKTREEVLAHLKSEGKELPDGLTDLQILSEGCDWGFAYYNFRQDLWRMAGRHSDFVPKTP
jgi:hypothetical protein